MFHSLWLELTSLDMARHGPQSSVIDPVAWSETVYAEKCANWFYKMQLQSAENWTVLVEFAATGPFKGNASIVDGIADADAHVPRACGVGLGI